MNDRPFPDLKPHHAGLNVRDLEESIAFWTDTFGFEEDFRAEIPPIKAKIAFLKRDGYRLELFQIDGSAAVPEERLRPNTDLDIQGTKHICFSVEDPQVALEQLHDKGVRIVGVMRGHGKPMTMEDDPRLDPEGTKDPAMAFFFLDPSDILVEIIRRSDFQD